MIKLKSIKIEGFGSVIKPIKYKIDVPGLNKIEGQNGAGKTTITNALAWVGWGQMVKPKKSSIIPWPHVIELAKGEYKGTKVTLKLTDNTDKYLIIRCNEYRAKVWGKSGKNRLIIIKNGIELQGEGLRDKKDYQNWIIKKLGYTFELFKSTVLFTQELDTLMQEDGPTKKRIFDEAFETIFVNRAKKKAEDNLERHKKDFDGVKTKIDLLKTKIDGIRRSIKMAQEYINNFNKWQKDKIRDLKKNWVELRLSKKTLENKINESIPVWDKINILKEKVAAYEELVNEEFKLEMECTNILENIERIEFQRKDKISHWKNSPKKCGACNRLLPKESRIEHKRKIKKEISDLKNTIEDLYKKLEDKKEIQKNIGIKITKRESLKSKIALLVNRVGIGDNLVRDLKYYNMQIEEKLRDIKKEKELKLEKNDLPQLTKELGDLKISLNQFITDKKKIRKEIILNEWLIKDPLSNSGLKAFIFDSMLGRVNNYLKQYTPIIGFGLKVFIDMSSANKDIRISISKGGDEIPYEDLSKGQKQLANVVIAFSLSDTVQSIKPINAIFLDELFESLNAENIEKVGNIIIQKAKTKCIHLITHQTSFNPQNCNTTYVSLNSKSQTQLD